VADRSASLPPADILPARPEPRFGARPGSRAIAPASSSVGLPAFIVIGAMKSGTSSLYHYMRQHPDICMSSIKETDFFIEERNYGKGLDWYRSLFADPRKVCGEASPNYSKRHRHRGVPERLHRLVPEAKLIYLLRDPIDRIASHYLHNRLLGRETRSLAEAVAARSYRNNYVRTSLYHFQLSAFLRHFPLERILIATAEDLKAEQSATLASVFRFVGVDAGFEGSEFGRLFNETPVARQGSERPRMRGRAIGGLVDAALRPFRHTSKSVARPVLDQADRDLLAEHLAPDIDRLRALTGLRFERWSL
jgi:Sulfotransferase domain